MKSCFFIGHREADERLLPTLVNAIERLVVSEDVTCFYVGGYGAFDRIAAAAVKQVKQRYPEITLMLVLPYHPQSARWKRPMALTEPTTQRGWKLVRENLPLYRQTSAWWIMWIG